MIIMIKNIKFTLLLAILLASGVSAGAAQKEPLRIMCLGDSITVGYTDNPHWKVPFKFGYRSRLYKLLKGAGYEVLIFHATGTGGKTMESLIESGMVSGVLDITTTEWADELTGATLSAGPTRMDAMSKAKVPAVISPGCLDMANFGERDTVPENPPETWLTYHLAHPESERTATANSSARPTGSSSPTSKAKPYYLRLLI